MKEQLNNEFQKRLKTMFRETNKHFAERSYGSKKTFVNLTVPFMVLENWRENGHSEHIPLLDEAVKNIVFAAATSIFGWEKTSYLHLRVSLENIFYGISLLANPTLMNDYRNNGTIQYVKFSKLISDYSNISKITKKTEREFHIKKVASDLYGNLSKWSHTLGNDFISDLSNLGFRKMENETIGNMKGVFTEMSRLCCIIYLSVRPTILSDLNATDQRFFLQQLDLSERKKIREIIGV